MKSLFLTFLLAASSAIAQPSYVLENARTQARTNAALSALDFIDKNGLYRGWSMNILDDVSQDRKCLQGSGWVNVELWAPGNAENLQLICSTYSAGFGCFTEHELKAQSIRSEQKTCVTADKLWPPKDFHMEGK
jgi:hypothetical protein